MGTSTAVAPRAATTTCNTTCWAFENQQPGNKMRSVALLCVLAVAVVAEKYTTHTTPTSYDQHKGGNGKGGYGKGGYDKGGYGKGGYGGKKCNVDVTLYTTTTEYGKPKFCFPDVDTTVFWHTEYKNTNKTITKAKPWYQVKTLWDTTTVPTTTTMITKQYWETTTTKMTYTTVPKVVTTYTTIPKVVTERFPTTVWKETTVEREKPCYQTPTYERPKSYTPSGPDYKAPVYIPGTDKPSIYIPPGTYTPAPSYTPPPTSGVTYGDNGGVTFDLKPNGGSVGSLGKSLHGDATSKENTTPNIKSTSEENVTPKLKRKAKSKSETVIHHNGRGRSLHGDARTYWGRQ